MTGRRITYLVLLAAALILHLAYGQYLTHYMVLFLLCVPVLSLLVSIPSAVRARVELTGGKDVCRGRETKVLLKAVSRSFMPPEAWNITVESRNVFTGRTDAKQKVRINGKKLSETEFSPDTSQLGSIRYRIKSACVLDYLGIIPIPVKKSGDVSITVLPDKEKPDPEPNLAEASVCSLRPKPQGFSEDHELRPYREGDPLNLIHWKLSRKFDDYILREPQEIVRKDIILVADQPAVYDEHRSVLEQLNYINTILLKNEVSYQLQYGHTGVKIDSVNDFDDLIKGVLSEPMKSGLAKTPTASNDALIYRVVPGRGETE